MREQNAGDSRERIRRFTFDFCLPENSTQDDVRICCILLGGNWAHRRLIAPYYFRPMAINFSMERLKGAFMVRQVFQAVENVISKAIKRRYHSCVLAYGQSSSGKTHTMMGFPHDPGVTPKLCQRIFDYLKESAVGNELQMTKVAVR